MKTSIGIAVNLLLCNKKSQNIYTAGRSECNVKCKKQVNLVMKVDGEKRHYKAIKSLIQVFIKIKRENQAGISLLHELP